MRSEIVTVAGQSIVIREMLIKDLKSNLLQKIEPAWGAIMKGQVSDIIDNVAGQIHELFPELAGVDIDECYPSEIEGFVEAWINVNFSGLKRIVGPLWSLGMKGLPLSE